MQSCHSFWRGRYITLIYRGCGMGLCRGNSIGFLRFVKVGGGILWKFCGNKTLLAVLLVNICQESGANRVRIGLATCPRTLPFTLLFGYPPYPRLFFPQ